jgi:hypothetical protein
MPEDPVPGDSVPPENLDISPGHQNERTEQDQEERRSEYVSLVRALVASGAFALVFNGICSYLSVAGVIDMMTARLILFITWCIAVLAIVVSELVWGRNVKHKTAIGFFVR